MPIASLVLAGGRSRRMGSPKEALLLAGDTMLGRTAALLLGCTAPVVVVRRSLDQALPELPPEVAVIADARPGAGPLLAIATGLRHLRQTHGLRDDAVAFVTGCDAPLLTRGAVDWLAGQLGAADVAMPRAAGRLQPLCAVYRLRCLAAIDALLAEGVHTPRTIVERTDAIVLEEPALRAFDPALRFLQGMNTPAEYEAARRAVEGGEPS